MRVCGLYKCIYLTARFAKDAKIAEKKYYFSFAVERTAKEKNSSLSDNLTTDEGALFTAASLGPKRLLIFAFRPLSGKQKNKTSPLRAQRLCGENK